MNIKQLNFAHVLASTGSFTAAAEECCTTQPALSNSIAQLEDELGERLFQRTTRKVTLTPFGTHLMPYLKDVLNAQESLRHQANIFLKPNNHLVRIGISPLLNANIVGLALEPFRRQNPNVEIVFREMNMSDLQRMLNEGLLDFAFGVANVYSGTWERTFFYDEPLIYLASGEVPKKLRGVNRIPFKDIANEVYVMVPDACGLSRAIRSLFRRHRKKLQEYTGEAMSYQVLSEWAALGIGAAILPQSKLNNQEHPYFFITDKQDAEVKIEFEAIWMPRNIKAKHLKGFSKHLQDVVPRIISGLKRSNN